MNNLVTIAETHEYFNKSKKMLSESEQKDIIDYLSAHPKAGVLIQGAGGIRKLRWKHDGKGKRGGIRVIYYYYNELMPLYLLTLFGKNQKTDIKVSERNELGKLTKVFRYYWLGE